MTTYRYKNTTDQDLTIVGVGVVEAGKVIESDTPVDNPNLEPVSDKTKKLNKEDGDVE
ncbi:MULTISPECIES: hypothetical protein [Mycolicibacterium]|uniref:hypothetical protein n=1 Tax=Mycolicibacterium TaxID=1866885 RepID=UPI0013F4C9D9|nr:hypothetical protein [Mycolicibacterium porcinum]